MSRKFRVRELELDPHALSHVLSDLQELEAEAVADGGDVLTQVEIFDTLNESGYGRWQRQIHDAFVGSRGPRCRMCPEPATHQYGWLDADGEVDLVFTCSGCDDPATDLEHVHAGGAVVRASLDFRHREGQPSYAEFAAALGDANRRAAELEVRVADLQSQIATAKSLAPEDVGEAWSGVAHAEDYQLARRAIAEALRSWAATHANLRHPNHSDREETEFGSIVARVAADACALYQGHGV